jgi:tRNA(Ile)-lysidine synthase
MLPEFLKYIHEKQLFNPSDKVLLAISGGMDSIVLADLLSKTKIDFAMAHCNFCLRGEESDADEDFVKKLAKKFKVSIYSEKFDTKAFAEQEKVSIQMAARMLRYTWFDQILTKEHYQYLVTAHHQNDVLETVILNFTRGTGISGFHGIRVKSGNIIRPLLFADREQIRDYVAEHQLAWREDSSNESNKYARNLVRNEVIPLLKQINSNLEETVFQTVEKVDAVEHNFYERIEKLEKEIKRVENGAVLLTINSLKDQPSIVIFELLKNYNFNYADVKEIQKAFDEQPGKQFISPTHVLVKDRDQLVITAKDISGFTSLEISEETKELTTPTFKLSIEITPNLKSKIQTAKSIATLDLEKLKFPLKLRKWKEGDWFIPLGMHGKKKISDFLIDQKVPLNLKDNVYVITSGDSIVWIVGMRIDDRFKIIDNTENCCFIKMS